MVSSQLRQYIDDFDEIVEEDDPDFAESGLKVPSVIRVGLVGAVGEIGSERLWRIRERLAHWLTEGK